jgi:hypothetical protein
VLVVFLVYRQRIFLDIILMKDHASLSFKHKDHGILSQKYVAKNNFMKYVSPTKKG